MEGELYVYNYNDYGLRFYEDLKTKKIVRIQIDKSGYKKTKYSCRNNLMVGVHYTKVIKEMGKPKNTGFFNCIGDKSVMLYNGIVFVLDENGNVKFIKIFKKL